MGVFDKLRAAGAPSFDPQRAIMTIVVAAVKADGLISDDEVGRIRSMCARSPIFASNTAEEDNVVISFADTVTEQNCEQAIAQASNALKAPLRETAFAFACDMILADGIINDEEERYVTQLATRLGLEDEVVNAVVQTTIIRNRGLSV